MSETYCVDSGLAVPSGARCPAHAGELAPCFTAQRAPRCLHRRWPADAHGSRACPECGALVITYPPPAGGVLARLGEAAARVVCRLAGHEWDVPGEATAWVCTWCHAVRARPDLAADTTHHRKDTR